LEKVVGSSKEMEGRHWPHPLRGANRPPSITPAAPSAAALDAVENLLPAGHQSLGIRLDIRHYAATPVGMRIRATAELVKINGRTLEFRVEARDEKEPIGDGTHERVIVNVERFDQRVQKKLGGTG